MNDLVLIVAQNLGALCLMMAVGFVCRKKGLLTDEVARGLSSLLLSVSLPCTVIMSLQRPFDAGLLQEGLVIIALNALMTAIMWGAGILLTRVFKIKQEQRGVYIFAMVFGNIVYMGLPVLHSAFGDGVLFYIAASSVLFNITSNSIGITIMKSGKGEKGALKPNITLLSAVVAVLLFVLSIKLPFPVKKAFEALGGTTVPLSMLVTGSALAMVKKADLFENKTIWIPVMMRNMISPLIAIVIALLFLPKGMMRDSFVYLAGMPAAAITAIFAERYNGDVKSGSALIFFSTIFSMLTIPLIAIAIGLFLPI